MADDGIPYYEPEAIRTLARKIELYAYDLRAHLKEFKGKTGEESITDGFGVLTESEEVTSAYVAYSADVASAMKAVHEHVDKIADALRKVNRDTEVTDDNLAVLFGKQADGDR
ncbi:hypothetical protein [Streptomyces sp. NPDC002573]|uniref:hypothetical protein n=1 Tax=Streptomyces sp. NPDC002573 TaxID=3364651 RepID=UPI003695BADE